MSTKIREDVPELPEAEMPQTGWHKAEVYAFALGMTWRTFQDNVTKQNVPHRMFGKAMLIQAEEFYGSLPLLGRNPPDAPPKRKRTRKRVSDG